MSDDNRRTIRTRPLSAWNAPSVLHADAADRLGCTHLSLAAFNQLLYVAFGVGVIARMGSDAFRVTDVEAWDEMLLAADARLRLAPG